MKIDSTTSLYCILGKPVKHSFSPYIHNRAFQKLRINAVYLAFQPENLKDAINGIRALGIKGCSVTIPFKSEIISYLDEISEISGLIGAVNTVLNREGKLIGTNTDAFGFYKALSNVASLTDKNVAIFGAGGSARAGIFSLFYYDKPSKVFVLARNREKRELVRKEILASFDKVGKKVDDNKLVTLDIAEWKGIMDQIDVIVNTTPLGMIPDVSSSVVETFPEKKVVMDIVYNPVETKFLKLARKKKCHVISGIEMLLFQAVKQFEFWTGMAAPIKEMRKAIYRKLN